MDKRTRNVIFRILPDIVPTAIRVYLVFVMVQKTSRMILVGMILGFLPIMPIIDVEKVQAKIRRQRLGIHGEDSDSESEDSESDIALSETPPPDNIQNRGGTATKGSGPFGGSGGGGPSKKSTPKKERDTRGGKNPKDKSFWKKLWDWVFG